MTTAESEARGAKFVNWYGASYKYIARRIRGHDDEVAADTMLQIYNDIVYKDLHVRNYKTYFIRAYHTNKLKGAIADAKHAARIVSTEDLIAWDKSTVSNSNVNYYRDNETHKQWAQLIETDFDSELYEATADALCNDMLAYVRETYEPREVAIFEIYVGLYPDVRCENMASFLGLNVGLVYSTIGAIKKDLRIKYAEKRLCLLSFLK